MKTKKFKRVLTLVLALAMMLSLSMVSFATGDTVDLYIEGVYEDSYEIGTNSTVYDIVVQLASATWSNEINAVAAYSPLCELNNPLYGLYNQKVIYLRSLNNTGSAPHTPANGALDEDDYYIPEQTVDTVLMEADEALEEYGGLEYWFGNGYGFAADGIHMVYVGWDWEFTVNGSQPHKPINDPAYNNDFQFTMRESLLEDGDEINVYYDYYFMVFDPAHM